MRSYFTYAAKYFRKFKKRNKVDKIAIWMMGTWGLIIFFSFLCVLFEIFYNKKCLKNIFFKKFHRLSGQIKPTEMFALYSIY